MPKPSYTDLAPIAALATAPGPAALAVIRTTGPGSLDLLARVFSRPAALREAPGNTIVYGWIMKEGEVSPLPPDRRLRLGSYGTPLSGGLAPRNAPHPGAETTPETCARARIDEVLVNVYRAPRSYTGEDGADIICHGGNAAPKAVLDTLLRAGFREALRGEFTFRAFTNGKLGLAKAESVLEMVEARTDKARENAAARLSGVLETEIDAIKQNLVTALAALELSLDYSELDGVEDAPEGLPCRALIDDARTRLETLAAAYRSQRLSNEGALVVIAGKPNAGKSSVFNLLLKEERAIVTPIPGTTRDYIEATLDSGGIPIRLIDTAGIHDDAGEIEAEGIRRSRALMDEADLVLLVKDSSARGARMENGKLKMDNECARSAQGRTVPVIIVWNKIDLANTRPSAFRTADGVHVLPLSAKTGEGLPALVLAVSETLLGGPPPEHGPALGTERQRALVDRAIAALKETLALAGNPPETPPALDLAAPALKDAVDALGEITGEVTNDAILTTMFSRFCVGK